MGTRHPNFTAEYRFDGNATDTSGAGLNGSATGVTYAAGLGSRVGVFASASSARVTTAAKLPLEGDWTMTAWVRVTAWTVGYIVNQTDLTGDGRVLILVSGADTLRFASGATNREATIALNTWYHVAVRKQSGVLSAWVNNVQIGADISNANALPDLVVQIGGTDRIPGRNSDSQIARVRIFNAALDANDIRRDTLGLLPIGRYV